MNMEYYWRGNQDLLQEEVTCLYCSRSLPQSISYPIMEFLQSMLKETVTLASGWHSPVEKKALQLRAPLSSSNIIFYLAKGINHFQLPATLNEDFKMGKVLIVSQWMDDGRIDKRKARQRNELMLNNHDRHLFLHIEKGGHLEKHLEKCLALGKKVFLFDPHKKKTNPVT